MKTKFLAIAFASLLPFAASADVSYNNIDLSYQFGGKIDFGFGSADTDGLSFKGQYAINDSWFAEFDYYSLGTDPDIDSVDGYSLLAGWHGEMFFVKGGYENAGATGGDDAGFNIDFGLRTMMSEAMELNAHLGMSDVGDFGTTTNYGVGAVYMFNDNMGVSFNYDLRSVSDFAATPGFDIDTTSYGLGFRYNF